MASYPKQKKISIHTPRRGALSYSNVIRNGGNYDHKYYCGELTIRDSHIIAKLFQANFNL